MFVGPKAEQAKWHRIPNLLNKPFSLDRIPGGVKMACSTVALALVLWFVVQFSSQSGLSAVREAAATLRMPVDTIQSYLTTYRDWHNPLRVRRGARKLPQLENRELGSAVNLVENQLNMMERHEKNILGSNVKVKLGSVLHGAYVDSLPSTEALQHGRDAMVVVRASQHIGNKYCYRLGIDDMNCATQVSKFSLRPTSLGLKCAAHHRQAVFCSELTRFRSLDGSCNHPQHPAWGQALTAYKRLLPPQYDDGFQSPRGSRLTLELPNARLISTTLSENRDLPDSSVTLATLQWGQFVAQDLSHTAVSKMWNTGGSIACCDGSGRKLSPRHVHQACFPIQVMASDPVFSSQYQTCMSYVRSLPALRPDCTFGPLEQLNQATHFLDGSMVYGTTGEKASALRSRQFGRLRTVMRQGREFLPTTESLTVSCHVNRNSSCYQTGDPRVNTHPHLAVMYTLWVREHNRVAEKLSALNSHWSDERLYQEARRIVIAQIQHITYNEWLPSVLGTKYMQSEPLLQLQRFSRSSLFREDVDPGVSNSFATAAMRSLNSMVDDEIRLYNENRSPNLVSLPLHHFHRKETMHADDHLDSLVRGLATQSAQKMDLHHSHRMQHRLYSMSSSAEDLGLDAFSLDIQRGRDHGLPSYNTFRAKCGIRRARDFGDLADTIPVATIMSLSKLYKNVNDIDLLVGGMSEYAGEGLLGPVFKYIIAEQFKRTRTVMSLSKLYKNVNDIDLLVGGMSEYAGEGLLGPVFKCIIAEQFKRSRVGDRFFYDNAYVPGAFTENQLREIKKSTLARIFCDNTNNVLTMQPYVFYKPVTPSNELAACSESSSIRRMDLDAWYEEPPRSVLQGL